MNRCVWIEDGKQCEAKAKPDLILCQTHITRRPHARSANPGVRAYWNNTRGVLKDKPQ